jgi:hypothetical protein
MPSRHGYGSESSPAPDPAAEFPPRCLPRHHASRPRRCSSCSGTAPRRRPARRPSSPPPERAARHAASLAGTAMLSCRVLAASRLDRCRLFAARPIPKMQCNIRGTGRQGRAWRPHFLGDAERPQHRPPSRRALGVQHRHDLSKDRVCGTPLHRSGGGDPIDSLWDHDLSPRRSCARTSASARPGWRASARPERSRSRSQGRGATTSRRSSGLWTTLWGAP